MNWKTIDTTEDLKTLDQAICPSDSERLGYYASDHMEEFYPDGNPELRCARMIYRFLSEDEVQRISYGRINGEAERDYGASSY